VADISNSGIGKSTPAGGYRLDVSNAPWDFATGGAGGGTRDQAARPIAIGRSDDLVEVRVRPSASMCRSSRQLSAKEVELAKTHPREIVPGLTAWVSRPPRTATSIAADCPRTNNQDEPTESLSRFPAVGGEFGMDLFRAGVFML
jgi:hypothetical protein